MMKEDAINEKRYKIDIEYSKNYKGNWNHNFPDEPPKYGKPIKIMDLEYDKFIWTHKEIFELLKQYNDIDKETMKMILDPTIDTGLTKQIEKPFKEKLLEFIYKWM